MSPSVKAFWLFITKKAKIPVDEETQDEIISEIGVKRGADMTVANLLNFCKKKKIPYRPAQKKKDDWLDKFCDTLDDEPNFKKEMELLFTSHDYKPSVDDFLDKLEAHRIIV